MICCPQLERMILRVSAAGDCRSLMSDVEVICRWPWSISELIKSVPVRILEIVTVNKLAD